MRRLDGELFAEVGAELGEGPVWDELAGRLIFVDIAAGRLHATADDGSIELLAELDVPLGAALPATEPEEYLLVAREGFRRRGSDGSVTPVLEVLGERPGLRFNDAKCDPAGRCFAGTLSLREEPGQGTLFRLDDGPTATPVVNGVGLSNGLGWSPDGMWLYFADTVADRVDRYAYDPAEGRIGAGGPFVAISQPDGLCVDDSGALWVARWDAGTVERYTPDGVLDTVLDLPVPHATSCAFYAGRLIVTTARASGPDGRAAAPHAGDLFAADVGASAPPAPRWRPVGGAP